ncbi:MarR family transcriptional regulator [Gammaproteobacteria bacterium 54_18_T64]|nr:MarR family transcriptional regulator [Gammaproteobacteria bacterium 54_18_T64]
MKTQKFNFSEMICFSLYSTSNTMIREYRSELAEYNLTYPQFLVMMSLWNKDGVFIKDLTTQTLLDAATLTAILKKLNNKGFLQYERSPKDKRAKVVILTETGKNLRLKTSHIFTNMECRVELTKESQKQLISTCHEILENLS